MPLTAIERQLLAVIRENSYASQTEYAERIGLSRSTTANLISKLQDDGYILGKPYVLNTAQRIICIGGANIDRKMFLKQSPLLETSNPVYETVSFGGVMRNIAENLGRLSVDTGLMTFVGDDLEGRGLLKEVSQYVDIASSECTKKAKTSSYVAIINDKGDLYMGLAAMDICNEMNAQWIIDKQRYLMQGKWLSCDLNVMHDGVSTLISLAKDKQKKLAIVGVSSPKMANLPDNLEGVTVGFFNVNESMAYFKTTNNSPETLCQLWLDKGLEMVVVTAGSQGFAFGSQKKGVAIAAVQKSKNLVDVTGAGDAFTSGTLYGLIKGFSLEKAINYGRTNASLVIESKDSVRKDLSEQLLEGVVNIL